MHTPAAQHVVAADGRKPLAEILRPPIPESLQGSNATAIAYVEIAEAFISGTLYGVGIHAYQQLDSPIQADLLRSLNLATTSTVV